MISLRSTASDDYSSWHSFSRRHADPGEPRPQDEIIVMPTKDAGPVWLA